MFSIFSLRQPDVLGVGDLGLQKGLLRWVISSHDGNDSKSGIPIHPRKLAAQPGTMETVPPPVPDSDEAEGALPTSSASLGQPSQKANVIPTANRPIELPPGLTLSTLKARLNGSKVKGQYLTPDEMYFLTKSWRPYRSLGCYYLWQLSGGE